MERPEIILNLWYVVDDIGVIYSLRVRAYIGTGTEADKLKLLQKFATTDYLIAKAFPIPKSFHMNRMAVFNRSALDLLPNKASLFEEAIQQ